MTEFPQFFSKFYLVTTQKNILSTEILPGSPGSLQREHKQQLDAEVTNV